MFLMTFAGLDATWLIGQVRGSSLKDLRFRISVSGLSVVEDLGFKHLITHHLGFLC